MKKEKYLPVLLLALAICAGALLWLIMQKPGGAPGSEENAANPEENVSIEENLFSTYEAVTADFKHPDDLGPDVLPPTPSNIPIYDIRIKSYDFNPEKTGFVGETAADDNMWCRILPLTPSLWAYYFEDYHYELRWENGERWNPDFNDVVVVVWKTENAFKIRAQASVSTFRNELWIGGKLEFDNVAAHVDEVIEIDTISRLR